MLVVCVCLNFVLQTLRFAYNIVSGTPFLPCGKCRCAFRMNEAKTDRSGTQTFGCVYVIRRISRSPDEDGVDGIYLGEDVVIEASRGLSNALTIIAARVLDIEQILQYVFA